MNLFEENTLDYVVIYWCLDKHNRVGGVTIKFILHTMRSSISKYMNNFYLSPISALFEKDG